MPVSGEISQSADGCRRYNGDGQPHEIDIHQRAVPRPIDLNDKCSPRRMITRSVTALIQISTSFRTAEANVVSDPKNTNVWRITTIAKSEMKSPTHVAHEIFVGTDGRLEVRVKGALRFSVSIIPLRCRKAAFGFKKSKASSSRCDEQQAIGRRSIAP